MLQMKRGILLALLSVVFTGFLMANVETAVAADSGNLSWGSNGTAVSELQQILNNKDYACGEVDGIFGPQTYDAVIRFQGDAGLQKDGIVGPATKRVLGISAALVSRSGTDVNRGKVVTMVATGYDDSWESNYPYYGQPSYIGLPLARGIIATDPNVIPMGTRLYVEGYGEGIAADQGGAIKGNRIDLFFDSKQEALNWGMKTVKVTILN